MGTPLNRNQPANWGTDPVVPNPLELVRAAALPGGVRPALQNLYSMSFDILRGVVSFNHLSIAAGSPEATAAVVPPAANDRGLKVVAVGGGYMTFSAGGLVVSNAASSAQVVVSESQVGSITEGFRCDNNGFFITTLGLGTARYRPHGAFYVGVPNPGRTTNSANDLRPALGCKAWGLVLASGGAIGTQDGEGGWTASIVANRVRITLAQALLDTVYVVNVTPVNASGDFTALENYATRTTSSFDLVFRIAGVERDAADPGGIGFQFSLHGRR